MPNPIIPISVAAVNRIRKPIARFELTVESIKKFVKKPGVFMVFPLSKPSINQPASNPVMSPIISRYLDLREKKRPRIAKGKLSDIQATHAFPAIACNAVLIKNIARNIAIALNLNKINGRIPMKSVSNLPVSAKNSTIPFLVVFGRVIIAPTG